MRYTAVQHSGYGYGEKDGFKQGLEMREIKNETQRKMVLIEGGYIFEGYVEVMEFCEKEQHPELSGLYPKAPGEFSNKKIDGLRIYRGTPESRAKRSV